MSSGRILASIFAFLVGLGVLYSYLSRQVNLDPTDAGVAMCIFGVVIVFGLVGLAILLIRRK